MIKISVLPVSFRSRMLVSLLFRNKLVPRLKLIHILEAAHGGIVVEQ
jgi:hypothetical protein